MKFGKIIEKSSIVTLGKNGDSLVESKTIESNGTPEKNQYHPIVSRKNNIVEVNIIVKQTFLKIRIMSSEIFWKLCNDCEQFSNEHNHWDE